MRIGIILLAAFFAACSAAPSTESNALPEDLARLRKLQKEKKADAKALESELARIDEKITALSGNISAQKRLVTVIPVTRTDFNRYALIQGSVQADDLVAVSSETGGRITYMPFVEGQAVRRGQLIAKIDLDALIKQRAELEKALELARDIYDRQARLWKQNIGSEVQYLQAKNNVERTEKSIETIDFQLTKANIYAPISGVVDMVNLKQGETAGPGGPIVMILDTRNLKVVADVPENYLGKVKRGDNVDLHFPALNVKLNRRVTLIGRKIDPANRTFKVEIKIPSTNANFKPNLLVEVRINDYTEKDVLIISQELVQQEVGGKEYVMLASGAGENATALKKYVTLGESYEGQVIVNEGIKLDDQLIDVGGIGLTDGESIKIVESQNPQDAQ